MLNKRPAIFASIFVCLLTTLGSCANTVSSDKLERSLAADPKLKNNQVTLGKPSPTNTPSTVANLPANFPAEIPIYQNAQLQEVVPLSNQFTENQTNINNQGQLTRWTTSDPSNLVQDFYQKQFQSNNWEIISQPASNSEDNAAANTLVARKNDLRVTVSVKSNQAANNPTATPSPNQTVATNPQGTTEFTVEYTPETAVLANANSNVNSVSTNTSQTFSDLNKAPKEFQPYIEDLAALGVINIDSSNKTNLTTNTQFEPNKIITRGEFARWLVTANNQLHSNNPSKQVRLASETAQPAFTDIPANHPDFAVIQGLAEAGLIPSRLTGDATAVLFRPEAPLTRENLILWKVPLDSRQGLPNASVDAVKETWGFQDAAKINPKALRAVLADFQEGDSGNIRRLLGYTTLFQPQKPVTRAEAAAVLWYFGSQAEGISAKDGLQLKQQQNQPSPTPEVTSPS